MYFDFLTDHCIVGSVTVCTYSKMQPAKKCDWQQKLLSAGPPSPQRDARCSFIQFIHCISLGSHDSSSVKNKGCFASTFPLFLPLQTRSWDRPSNFFLWLLQSSFLEIFLRFSGKRKRFCKRNNECFQTKSC